MNGFICCKKQKQKQKTATTTTKKPTLFFLCGYIHEFWGSLLLVNVQFSW